MLKGSTFVLKELASQCSCGSSKIIYDDFIGVRVLFLAGCISVSSGSSPTSEYSSHEFMYFFFLVIYKAICNDYSGAVTDPV